MPDKLKTFEDQKRGRTGIGTVAGLVTGAIVGLVVGTTLSTVTGTLTPIVFMCAFGGLLGALMGAVFMNTATEDTVAPGISGRSHVGARNPDAAEATQDPRAAGARTAHSRAGGSYPPKS